MPLPANDIAWPPDLWVPAINKMREHAAWLSGDTNALAEIYGRVFSTEARASWKFWSRVSRNISNRERVYLHMPVASDLASTSSAMLFSEEPVITGNDRLEEIVNESGLSATLLEAAEISSALGGVYLRTSWDKSYFDYPFLSVIHPDYVIPEFKWGKLQAATLWDVVQKENQRTWRHIERHEPGFILNALYEGSPEKLGRRVSLNTLEQTAQYKDVVLLPDPTMMLVRYVPNMKPNRTWRTGQVSNLGQSDYAGAEGIMDALDEVWTSWIRDIRLARARLVVPKEYLNFASTGSGPTFDLDTEVFTPVDMDPRADNSIKGYQFDIRSEDHRNTALDLLERIVNHAGYSPQTFGINIVGRAESGTALRIRERKTFVTQQKKSNYWKASLIDSLEMMLAIDKWVFGSTYETPEITIAISDSVSQDIGEVSQVVELLNRAQAVSTDTKVRMLHPEWTDEMIQEEVSRILNESGLGVDVDTVFPGVSL